MMRIWPVLFLSIISACATDSRRGELIQLHTQARDAYVQKDWQSAGKYYLEITRQVPTDVDAWYRLGNIYARLNQPADAVLVYREALVRERTHSRAWYNLSIMHLRQSAATLIEMQQQIRKQDPLYDVSEKMLLSIFELLGTERPESSAGDSGTASGNIENSIEWEQIVIKTKPVFAPKQKPQIER